MHPHCVPLRSDLRLIVEIIGKDIDERNGVIMKRISMTIFASLTLVFVSSAQSGKNDCTSEYFTFFEKADVTKPADLGIVTLKIKTEDASFEKAILENEMMRDDVRNSIVKSGISEDRIKAANYSSIPVAGFFSGKTRKHKIENRVDVIISDEKELARVARVVDDNDNIEYVGIKFDLENEDSLKMEIRQKAFNNVKVRKKEIEREFQVTLSLVGYKELKVEDVEYFDREIKTKSMAYNMVLREEVAPHAAFNSLELETGILFTFKIAE